MILDASAIVAMLCRAPAAEALLARIDAAETPLMTTPVSLLAATEALARAKAPGRDVTPALLAAARAAVAELASALALREVPVTAELGRRAAEILAAGGGTTDAALAAAAARAYRVPLCAAS